MEIRSNILGVIGQLERLQRNIPVALERALAPGLWVEEATELAEGICLALAQGSERALVPGFVKTVKAMVMGSAGGLLMTMNTPLMGGPVTVGSAAAAQSARSNKDRGMGLFDRPISEFEQLMTRWVAEEKDKDERDYGKSDEDIGQWITYILLSSPGSLTKKEREARTGLMRHIPQWIAKQQGAGVSAETADLWLRSVLAGWRTMVRTLYPGKVRAVLGQMQNEL